MVHLRVVQQRVREQAQRPVLTADEGFPSQLGDSSCTIDGAGTVVSVCRSLDTELVKDGHPILGNVRE